MTRTMRRLFFFIVRMLVYLALFIATSHFIKELLAKSHPKGIKLNIKSLRTSDTKNKTVIPYRPSTVPLFSSTPLPFCDGLFRGDRNVVRLANQYMRDNPKLVLEDNDYEKMTTSCDQFKKSRRYVLIPTSNEERDFSIAFSIIAYKGAEQVERLLRSIYMPQNFYCIHYDAKSSLGFRNAMDSIARCFDNVFVASDIIPVRWGTIDVLDAEMICLRNLIKYQWKYFINLTGQEMPLLSNRQLVRILKAYNGANDVEGTIKRRNRERFEFVHVNNRITKRRKSPPPWNMTITKGAIHIVASRKFIEFSLQDQRAKDLYKWLKDTGVPDESFFSTLNHNPHLGAPGAYKGIPETHVKNKPFLARFKNWNSGPFHAGPCHGQWVRDVCVLGIGDLAKLPQRRELFVNKFDIHRQYLAFECVEERIRKMTWQSAQPNFKLNISYYEKLPFVRNRV